MTIYQDEKTLKFIERAKLVSHRTECGYDKTVFVGIHTKVTITCLECGNDFEQRPDSHLMGNGCIKCNHNSRKLTLEEFIRKANKKHNYIYGYDDFIYKDSRTKSIIYCHRHKIKFTQSPSAHLQGQGCPLCGHEETARRHEKFSCIEEFIVAANNKFKNKIGYSFDYSPSVYVDITTAMCIRCKIHNKEFKQTPSNHLSGQGCPLCAIDRITKILFKGTEQFIIDSKKLFGDKFGYIGSEYFGSKKLITLYCNDCNIFFDTYPTNHLREYGRGCCPECKESVPEGKVNKYLLENNINFDRQFKFENCRDKYPLPFDFVVFDKDNNTKIKFLIEYQGEQHYRPIRYSSKMTNEQAMEELKVRQQHDSIKSAYCIQNKIPLLIIQYKQLKIIPSLINNFLDKYYYNEHSRSK